MWSDEASFTTQATVPERPDPLECTPDGPSDVLVTWGVPADGGAPINSYQLQRSDGDGPDTFEPIYNGAECQYRVSGLNSGVLYRFRVLAENEVGVALTHFGTAELSSSGSGMHLDAHMQTVT